MEKTLKKRRQPRRDCSYVIYESVCEVTGANYIGLTRRGSTTVARAVAERWRRHLSRARNESRPWALYLYLRTGGADLAWQHRVLEVVRGRAQAYRREQELVKTLKPQLNTQYL
jgi:hypothetical protein